MIRSVIILAVTAVSILGFNSFRIANDAYTLTIKKGSVTKQDGQTIWTIPTTLTNNTTDTLRYFSMSCSWQDFYSVDNKKLQVEAVPCDKNVPKILMLPPGQSSIVETRLLISQTIDASEIKFKIGFNLMKISNGQKAFDFDFREEQKKKNVIWSNTISM